MATDNPPQAAANIPFPNGLFIVFNERPPFMGGAIVESLKADLIERYNRRVHAIDYEDIISMAMGSAPNNMLSYREHIDRYEDMFFSLLRSSLERHDMVVLSGWIRKGPAGRRLLNKYLAIARGTQSPVIWVNSIAIGRSCMWEKPAAQNDDMRWTEVDDGLGSPNLDLIDPEFVLHNEHNRHFFQIQYDRSVEMAVESVASFVAVEGILV